MPSALLSLRCSGPQPPAAYIESATGIAAGGRTGLTAVVVALLFLLALFFAPFLSAVPSFAYGPSLIIVGAMMIAPITRLKFDDYSESSPRLLYHRHDELHVQHRHRDDSGISAVSAFQDSWREGEGGKAGVVGACGAIADVLCVLSVLEVYLDLRYTVEYEPPSPQRTTEAQG